LRTPDVQLVSSDALAYEIPDDVTVAYFHNPFQGEILTTVIDRLLESFDRRPRSLRVIYENPVEAEPWNGRGAYASCAHGEGHRETIRARGTS
jgi:hypothetical protein